MVCVGPCSTGVAHNSGAAAIAAPGQLHWLCTGAARSAGDAALTLLRRCCSQRRCCCIGVAAPVHQQQ